LGVCGVAWGAANHVDGKIDKVQGKIDKVEGKIDKVEGKIDNVNGKIDNVEKNLVNKIDNLATCFSSYAERMADRVGNIEGRLQIPFDKNAPAFNQPPNKPQT
jgi:uncharacterized protein YjbJ (UPF0337 family)